MAMRDQVLSYARSKLGDPYRWGATGPDAFDCSGLVAAAYKAAGENIGRPIASALGGMGIAVSADQALPGDVVYFNEKGSTDHVGIYVGNGQMIDAPHTGANVEVDPIRGYTSIRRIIGDPTVSPASALPGANVSASASTSDPGGQGWADDVMAIAVKLAAVVAAVVLFDLGVKQAVS